MEQFLNIIITTSVTALIILVVKVLLRNKISPKWQILIWVILAIRLAVPVLPKSNISIFNSVPQVKNVEVSDRVIKHTEPVAKTYIRGNVVVGEKNKEFVMNKIFVDNIMAIWITGSIIMILYMVGIYLVYNMKTKKFEIVADRDILDVLEKCKEEIDIRENVIVRLGGDTPLLKGISKPQIIIPEGYTMEELKSVFMHELMHLKHKDVLCNIAGTLLLCGYWYNPIIWYSFFVFRRDMEILCDYRVLQVYNNRKGYASVLLKTALRKNRFIIGTTSMQNGEKDITKRIKYIAYFKKPKVIWSIAAIAVAIAITGVCLTNPAVNPYIKVKTENELNSKMLYKYKTQYIGNASNVGNLAYYLYYSEYRSGMSLHTSSIPYSINFDYKVKPGDISQNGVYAVTDKMLKNAAIIFCLVGNVDTITFTYDDGSGIYSFPFEREFFNTEFKADIREYSSSYNKFSKEFFPMIDKKNWSKLKEFKYTPDTNIISEVEKNLKVIMSSPAQSSNSGDYIKAHQNEYENIVKMGDGALEYMLSWFEYGDTKGLKAHIMMSLCIDILGDRNNVKEGTYTSPEEWYLKLSPYKASRLPEFKYETKDKIEQMVYSAAIEKYSDHESNNSVTIVAPHIFGTYENGNELRIFVTVYCSKFKLYGKTLSESGGSIIPAAIIYIKNDAGNYIQKEYIEAKDGSEFSKSIEEFCKPRSDIANAIMKHYGNYEDLFVIMKNNLITYLNVNGMKGINLKQNNGEIVPLI